MEMFKIDHVLGAKGVCCAQVLKKIQSKGYGILIKSISQEANKYKIYLLSSLKVKFLRERPIQNGN